MRPLLVALLVCLWAGQAAAEDHPSTPLAEAEPAPFAGVLVTEAQLDRAITSAVAVEECRGSLQASETVRRSLTADLADAEGRAARPEASAHSEWPWVALGFVVGAASAGLAVWGAVEVMRAR